MKGLYPIRTGFLGITGSVVASMILALAMGCGQATGITSDSGQDARTGGGMPKPSDHSTQMGNGGGGRATAGSDSHAANGAGGDGGNRDTNEIGGRSGVGAGGTGGAAGQGSTPRGSGGSAGQGGPRGAGGIAGQPRAGDSGGNSSRGGSTPEAGTAGSSGKNGGPAAGGSAGTGGARGEAGGSSVGRGGTAGVDGAGGGPSTFMLGADISSVDEAMDQGTRYVDTDGTAKPILEILKNHGFNFIRLRTFVKPGARYGYAYGTGGTCVKSETYCDKEHTIAFAKQVKDAGMGFLLDFHYSDNWADPGNQIIPEDWRSATSVTELASLVKDYTKDVVSALTNAGARPDMVQIGNEITPGMLVHVPNSSTDCWGNNVSTSSVSGSTSNWTNLGKLLKAGVEGVKEVDSSIKAMVHIENTKNASAVVSWVRNALNQGVAIDVVGLSCYVAFQGEPSVWQNTFKTLASTFPDLSFVIAEYNPQRTQANRIMREMSDGRGLGTFFWEPTQSGEWGTSLFTASGGTMRAKEADFKEFDDLRKEYGL